MPKQVVKYQCNFCIKAWVHRKRAETHEAKCLHNPANKSCSTCAFAYRVRSEDGAAWCDKMGKEIFIPRIVIENCVEWIEKGSITEEDFDPEDF
jgi:hypothetical protein